MSYSDAGGMPPPQEVARAARMELLRRRFARELRERRRAGVRVGPRDRDAEAALELAERFERDGRI